MVKIDSLTKVYGRSASRSVRALDAVSFTAHPGEIYGLLGPNGAGKTTALRIISTALRPTSGGGNVAGFDLVHQPAEVRRSIGFLSANTGLYGRLSPREYLRYFAQLFGMDRRTADRRVEECISQLVLDEYVDRPCEKLSSGNRQRVAIARTILHSPPVLILDEPTSGLDVLGSRAILQLMRDCRSRGTTVLLSTHLMHEVEQLCDRVGIIHHGRLLFEGTTREFQRDYGDDLEQAFLDLLSREETFQ